MTVALPKHRELERLLRANIETGVWQPGTRIPSENLLSRQFGMAYMTVRQAVGTLVAEGLLQRVPGRGTFVCEDKAMPSSPVVTGAFVLLVPAMWQRLDPYYFPDVLGGFEETLQEAGLQSAICDYATAERAELFRDAPAVACLLIDRQEMLLVERLHDQGYKTLAINRYTGRRVLPYVAPDNAGGMAQAVAHLVALGHRRLAYIAGIPGNLDAEDRRRGFRAALRRHGLPVAPEVGHHFREEAGYLGALPLLCQPDRPTAFVCASDLSALGVIKAAREQGIAVPDALSVVGFGDFSLISYLDPGLTTVALPRRELGQCAARMLQALGAQGKAAHQTLPARLVIRATTGPPPDP